jgi:hypothetical protein
LDASLGLDASVLAVVDFVLSVDGMVLAGVFDGVVLEAVLDGVVFAAMLSDALPVVWAPTTLAAASADARRKTRGLNREFSFIVPPSF